jgi:putative membrane protein
MSTARKDSIPFGDLHAESLNTSTKLAFDRTRLAHDRTMLAWVRTATSLITFGFSFYKFFTFEAKGAAANGLIGPREFALLLIGIGLFSLLLATINHRQERTAMKAQDPEVPRSQAAALAAVIAVLGILTFGAVLFQL